MNKNTHVKIKFNIIGVSLYKFTVLPLFLNLLCLSDINKVLKMNTYYGKYCFSLVKLWLLDIYIIATLYLCSPMCFDIDRTTLQR